MGPGLIVMRNSAGMGSLPPSCPGHTHTLGSVLLALATDEKEFFLFIKIPQEFRTFEFIARGNLFCISVGKMICDWGVWGTGRGQMPWIWGFERHDSQYSHKFMYLEMPRNRTLAVWDPGMEEEWLREKSTRLQNWKT